MATLSQGVFAGKWRHWHLELWVTDWQIVSLHPAWGSLGTSDMCKFRQYSHQFPWRPYPQWISQSQHKRCLNSWKHPVLANRFIYCLVFLGRWCVGCSTPLPPPPPPPKKKLRGATRCRKLSGNAEGSRNPWAIIKFHRRLGCWFRDHSFSRSGISLWQEVFATTHLTACILNFHLSLTSRPLKWRTLSQRFKFRGPSMGGWIRRGWSWRFWDAPIFTPEVPKCLFQRVLGPLNWKSGRPQNAKSHHDESNPHSSALWQITIRFFHSKINSGSN